MGAPLNVLHPLLLPLVSPTRVTGTRPVPHSPVTPPASVLEPGYSLLYTTVRTCLLFHNTSTLAHVKRSSTGKVLKEIP